MTEHEFGEPKAGPPSEGDSAAACFDDAIAFGDGSLSTNGVGGGVLRLRQPLLDPGPSPGRSS